MQKRSFVEFLMQVPVLISIGVRELLIWYPRKALFFFDEMLIEMNLDGHSILRDVHVFHMRVEISRFNLFSMTLHKCIRTPIIDNSPRETDFLGALWNCRHKTLFVPTQSTLSNTPSKQGSTRR